MTQPPASDEDDLDGVRARIDALDRDLVGLIAAREQLVLRAGALKATAAAVRAPARVEQVVQRALRTAGELGADPVVVESTYRAMIGAFVDRELAATGLAASPEQPPAG